MTNRYFFILLLCHGLFACGLDGTPIGKARAPTAAQPVVEEVPSGTVPMALFGVNIPWEDLGNRSMFGGEMLRDRSFRINAGEPPRLFSTAAWEAFGLGGAILYRSSGGDEPAGAKSYPGYAEIIRETSGSTGVLQGLADKVEVGETYTLSFSSQGLAQSEVIAISIFDADTPGTPISYSSPATVAEPTFVQSGNKVWSRHTVTLRIAARSASPGIAISLLHPGTGGRRTLLIDEVRLYSADKQPQVKASISTAIDKLAIRSMRWPGGRVGDYFHWKSSIGPLSARGEEQAASSWQTPSFGLHEFLNYCEEKKLTPVLQVNFQNGPEDAADLTEYVLGDSSTPQGAIRAANGRSKPWVVDFFEIGNEPFRDYKGDGPVSEAGKTYATKARPVIAAIKAKSASLGKTVRVSGIIEPTFAYTDFLAEAAANPDPAYEESRMLYFWNKQVFESDAIGPVDILAGHFYDYLRYDPELTEAQAFPYVMAGGPLFEKIIKTTIRPFKSEPIWITEYAVYPTEEDPYTVKTERMMDFQSGLAMGDMLSSLVSLNIEGAQVYNLSQPWFGLLENPDTGNLRPTGHVFKLFSVLAGEERIKVKTNNTETVTITKGSGNVPSGMTYPLINAIATRGPNGKVRIILINRSYTEAKTVSLSFDQPVSGAAEVHRYENTDLTANNENGGNKVGITTSSETFGTPFSVTLQAHSLVRIDMK